MKFTLQKKKSVYARLKVVNLLNLMSFTALIFANFRLLPAVVLMSVSRAAVSPDNSEQCRGKAGLGEGGAIFQLFHSGWYISVSLHIPR